jgi:hypothetical protein
MALDVTKRRRRREWPASLLTRMEITVWRFGADVSSPPEKPAKRAVPCAEDTTQNPGSTVVGWVQPTEGNRWELLGFTHPTLISDRL